MFVSFLHFLANLLIALIIVRLLELTLADKYGADNAVVKALAFTH